MIVNDSFNKHDCVAQYYYQLSSLTIVLVGTRLYTLTQNIKSLWQKEMHKS